MIGPLDGLRIIDLTALASGPFATLNYLSPDNLHVLLTCLRSDERQVGIQIALRQLSPDEAQARVSMARFMVRVRDEFERVYGPRPW